MNAHVLVFVLVKAKVVFFDITLFPMAAKAPPHDPQELPPEYDVDPHGRRYQLWYNRAGKLHRAYDRPAVVCEDGYKAWYADGKLTRLDDKPAIMHGDGTLEWFVDDMRHRESGMPALIRANGQLEWYVHGVFQKEAARMASPPISTASRSA